MSRPTNPEHVYHGKPNPELPLFEQVSCGSGLTTAESGEHTVKGFPPFPKTSAPHSAPVVTDSLPAGIPQAPTRRGMPATSFEAARSVVNLGRTRNLILQLLREHGPQTDEQLAKRLSTSGGLKYLYAGAVQTVSPSGLRTRRAELVRMGLVEDSGKTAAISTGRQAILWRLK